MISIDKKLTSCLSDG